MIIRNIIYVGIIFLQLKSYCLCLCRTTNDHKNHTCNGHRFNQITLSLSTRNELSRIEIYDCKETEITEQYIKFPSGLHLTISCNTVKTIHANAFINVAILNALNLESNKISSLNDQVFSSNQQLEMINLSNNLFEEITVDTFKSASNLKVLLLPYNQINSFDTMSFRKNEKLEELYLNNNQISFVPVILFNHLRQLTTLDLSHNSMEIIPEAFTYNYQLQYLNLSHNGITQVPKLFDTTKLKVLDLSFNKLSIIHEDSLPLQTLEELYLQNNLIYAFDVTTTGISDYPLNMLDLSNNRLVYLNDTFISNAKNLNLLKVDNNPWDCKCFEQIIISRGPLEVELSIDYRTGEEPYCVYKHSRTCVINKIDVDSYYKILRDYQQLR